MIGITANKEEVVHKFTELSCDTASVPRTPHLLWRLHCLMRCYAHLGSDLKVSRTKVVVRSCPHRLMAAGGGRDVWPLPRRGPATRIKATSDWNRHSCSLISRCHQRVILVVVPRGVEKSGTAPGHAFRAVLPGGLVRVRARVAQMRCDALILPWGNLLHVVNVSTPPVKTTATPVGVILHIGALELRPRHERTTLPPQRATELAWLLRIIDEVVPLPAAAVNVTVCKVELRRAALLHHHLLPLCKKTKKKYVTALNSKMLG